MSDTSGVEGVGPSEFLADIALRLVERDLLAKESWRVAFAFAHTLDQLADAADGDDATVAEFAQDLIVDIVNTLLYAHIHMVPSEQDIDIQAKQFSDMFDRAEQIRKNKNENESEDN